MNLISNRSPLNVPHFIKMMILRKSQQLSIPLRNPQVCGTAPLSSARTDGTWRICFRLWTWRCTAIPSACTYCWNARPNTHVPIRNRAAETTNHKIKFFFIMLQNPHQFYITAPLSVRAAHAPLQSAEAKVYTPPRNTL